MTAPTFREIRRDLTAEEIAVRERIWLASQRGWNIALTEHEVRALHSSILQTGRELSALRDYVDFEEALA